MNGPSISRKPVGRKPVGAAVAGASFGQAVACQAPVPMTDPTPVTLGYNPMHQTPPMMPSSIPPHLQQQGMPASPAAQTQQWLHYSTMGPPVQAPGAFPLPVQHHLPTPVATPSAHHPPYPYPQMTPVSVAAPGVAPMAIPPGPPMPIPSTVLPIHSRQMSVQPTISTPVLMSPPPVPMQVVASPSQTPAPGQLRRTVTAGSTQSIPSDSSRRTSVMGVFAPTTPLSPVTTNESMSYQSVIPQSAGGSNGSLRACASCKQGMSLASSRPRPRF